MIYLETETENEYPDCESLLSIPYFFRQSCSQLIKPFRILSVWLGYLTSRGSQVDKILLSLRIHSASTVVRLDIPVMSEEYVVKEGLEKVIKKK